MKIYRVHHYPEEKLRDYILMKCMKIRNNVEQFSRTFSVHIKQYYITLVLKEFSLELKQVCS